MTGHALPHVVIVGGGFAGLAAARTLRRAPVRITIVDRRNHHLFQPLLYQVATAALNPGDIAYPIRSVLRLQHNARTLLARVTGIDLERRTLQLLDGQLTFDHLLLATGATHSYFGKDDWEAWAPGLKTIEDALEVRRRVLSAFEAAERQSNPDELPATLTFVVVGGGPTGVELAGALSEIGRLTVAKDFRSFDPRTLRVVLVEGAPRVLPPYSERLSAAAKRQLERLGVEVRTGPTSPGSTRPASGSATSTSRRAPCCGPPASPPPRSAPCSACRSIARVACSCSPTSACQGIRTCSSPAT